MHVLEEHPAPMPVAILDPAPTYRRGLLHALGEAGYLPEDPPDVVAWARRPGARAVLVTIRSAACLATLRTLSLRGPLTTVIALLVDPTPESHVEAWRASANAAVSWDATPEGIIAVLAAALEGNTLLPKEVAAALTRRIPSPEGGQRLSPEEVTWLRALAGGITIRALADQVGYSERGLYRLLCGVYRRLGVSSRLEAVLQAARLGLLDA